MKPAPQENAWSSRAGVELAIGMALGVVLLLLNICINFIRPLHAFFASYDQLRLSYWLVNFLFFWLVVLLSLAFAGWRQASRRSEELDRIVSSISPDALLVLDEQQTVQMTNESVRRLFGYPPQDIIGRKAGMLYERWRLGSEAPADMRESLLREGFYLGIATGRRKDGRPVPLEIIGAELKGEAKGSVLLLRDMTERLHAQEEQRELEARAEQWRRLESLSTFAGGLAHDLGNLLSVVTANEQLALQALPAEHRARGVLGDAVHATERAADECRRLLAGAGRSTPERTPVELSAVVRRAVTGLGVPLSVRVKLESALADGLPPVQGDVAQITHVVATLLTRALETVTEGGGRIGVRTAACVFDEALLAATYVNDHLPAGAYVCVEISDSGPTLGAKDLATFFDPFTPGRSQGRGVELAYALGIIRSHRGAVAVRSTAGEGTVISVCLPAAA